VIQINTDVDGTNVNNINFNTENTDHTSISVTNQLIMQLKQKINLLHKDLKTLRDTHQFRIIPRGIPSLLMSIISVVGGIAIGIFNPPISLIPAVLLMLRGIKMGYRGGSQIISDINEGNELYKKCMEVQAINKEIASTSNISSPIDERENLEELKIGEKELKRREEKYYKEIFTTELPCNIEQSLYL
jgi:hypothetical protein